MALVSVAEYRAAHIIESTAQDTDYTDEELEAFIAQASQYLATQCYQPLEATQHMEILPVGSIWCSVDRHQGLEIYPRYCPIQEVAEVAYRFSPGDSWDNTFAPSDYSVEDMRRIVIPYANPFRRHSWGQVRVSYTAGYTVIPDDIKLAAILLTAFWASAGYAAIDAAEGQPRAVVPGWAWERIERVIDRYKRRF